MINDTTNEVTARTLAIRARITALMAGIKVADDRDDSAPWMPLEPSARVLAIRTRISKLHARHPE